MSGLPEWELYALRYATVERTVHGNFLDTSALTDGPMPLDFFLWAARCGERVIVVDTGFNAASSARRGRRWLHDPVVALGALGIAADQVGDLIITHLHYDHAGNLERFPHAHLHLQEREMAYATGPCMCDPDQSHFFEADDIGAAVRVLFAGRLRYCADAAEIAPGVTVHWIGGHTAGLQVVRVHTARGWVVLASDAAHYYANLKSRNPFPAIHDLAEMLRGYERINELAASPAHIVPGHDPEVLRIFPLPGGVANDIACLHLPPLATPTGGLPARPG